MLYLCTYSQTYRTKCLSSSAASGCAQSTEIILLNLYIAAESQESSFFHCLCKYNTRIYALCNCLVVKDLAKCLQWIGRCFDLCIMLLIVSRERCIGLIIRYHTINGCRRSRHDWCQCFGRTTVICCTDRIRDCRLRTVIPILGQSIIFCNGGCICIPHFLYFIFSCQKVIYITRIIDKCMLDQDSRESSFLGTLDYA